MFSYGPRHMAEQKHDDQLEPTYSSSVRIRDVALRTYQKRWTIGRSGERGSGISVLAVRHDDDICVCVCLCECVNVLIHFQCTPCYFIFLFLSLWVKWVRDIVQDSFSEYIYIYVYMSIHIYPNPPLGQDMTQSQFFKRSLTGFEFRIFLLLD